MNNFVHILKKQKAAFLLFLIFSVITFVFAQETLTVSLSSEKFIFMFNPLEQDISRSVLTDADATAKIFWYNPFPLGYETTKRGKQQTRDENNNPVNIKSLQGYSIKSSAPSLALTGTLASKIDILLADETKPTFFPIGALKTTETPLSELEIVASPDALPIPFVDGVKSEHQFYASIFRYDGSAKKWVALKDGEGKPLSLSQKAGEIILNPGEGYLMKALKSFTIRLKSTAPPLETVNPTVSIISPTANEVVTTRNVPVQFVAEHADNKKINVFLDGQPVGELLNPTDTSITISGLISGRQYVIKVEVVNALDGTSLDPAIFAEVTITVNLPVTYTGVAGSGCEVQQDENKKRCTVTADEYRDGTQLAKEKEIQTCARKGSITPDYIELEWQTTLLGVGQACRVNPVANPEVGKEACAQTGWPPTLTTTDAAGNTVVHFQRPAANVCP